MTPGSFSDTLYASQIVIAWIKQWIDRWQTNPTVSVVATADHVELSAQHLIIGLAVGWYNRTDAPLAVKEVRLTIYPRGRKREPLRFYPLERFTRTSSQKVLQKSPVRPFSLPPGEVHTEQLRFLCQEILDIQPGAYAADVELIDLDDHLFTNPITLRLESRIKYRRSEEWHED